MDPPIECYSDCKYKSETDVIECDMCRAWVHKKCAASHDDWFEVIYEAKKKTRVSFWKCRDCTSLWNKLGTTNLENVDCLSSLSEELKSVRDELQNVKKLFLAEKEALTAVITSKENEIRSLECIIRSQVNSPTPTPTADLLGLDLVSSRSSPASPLHDRQTDLLLDGSAPATVAEAQPPPSSSQPSSSSSQISPHTFSHASHTMVSASVNVSGTSASIPSGVLQQRSETLQPRRNKKQSKAIGQAKAVIIGSSLLRGTFRHLDKNQIHVICRPGATAERLLREVSNFEVNDKVERVVTHVGGNDLSNLAADESPDYVVGDLMNLVSTLKEKFPRALVIVNGILWRKTINRNLVDAVNKDIAWMCSVQGARFANPGIVIRGEHYARDGIHLNDIGSEVFAKFLKNLSCPRVGGTLTQTLAQAQTLLKMK